MKGQHKIIFTGPVGAGKTTAISTISDIKPITTEQKATDETKQKKKLTTVAMDYGRMRLDNGETIHLYGTPGQDRFKFMRVLLSEGGIGLVILLDHTNTNPLDDLEAFLNSFKDFIKNTAVVVGINRIKHATQADLNPYHNKLFEHNITAAVFEVDSRSHDDVMHLIQALLYSLDPGLEEVSEVMDEQVQMIG